MVHLLAAAPAAGLLASDLAVQKIMIQHVARFPEKEHIQKDGRIKRWARIEAMENR
jgi:hypothetical protein